MALTRATSATIWEDSSGTAMARVVGADASVITQASTASIERKIFDLTGLTPGTAESTDAIVVADSVFDSLQTDARWTADSTGYNFRDTMAAANFPTGNHRYRVEYKFTPVAGDVFWAVFELQCQQLRSG